GGLRRLRDLQVVGSSDAGACRGAGDHSLQGPRRARPRLRGARRRHAGHRDLQAEGVGPAPDPRVVAGADGDVETTMTIGVLALQGDFAQHAGALTRVGVPSLEVRMPGQLEQVGGLVIPGGESTTLLKLLDAWDFVPALEKFHAAGKP